MNTANTTLSPGQLNCVAFHQPTFSFDKQVNFGRRSCVANFSRTDTSFVPVPKTIIDRIPADFCVARSDKS